MKRIVPLLYAVAASIGALARPINIPTQSVSPYADTEVSTNIVIHPSRTDVRDVKLHLLLDGTAYNDLEVGFGCDANTNGVLDVEEIETVYGWRGGRYFIENVRTWERFETETTNNVQRNAPVAVGDQVGRMSEANEPRSGRKSPRVFNVHMVLDSNSTLTSFTATCGGETAFSGFSTTHPPSWLYRNNWKLMRVVRRGAGTPSEWVRCEVGYNFFVIKLR